ncbi:hypothetical protein DH2020_020276 [Rehmannia glutinosa]|uniref:Aspartic peptidase DDI1-type domain-containing protein n=1 Tax=Rehmannia glutinosa TaxID=99300 RepID=A0ABR0WG82_REHGL
MANTVGSQMKNLENQVGQLAMIIGGQHQKGQFPSNTKVNPKKQCSAIHLRSGNASTRGRRFQKIKKICSHAWPRFQKKKLDAQFSKFLDIFKKLHINIPFVDTLEQMPNYAKFLKDVMSKKKKLAEFETVNLTEECSAIIQRKLPQKLKDPGSFTISCKIGGVFFDKALCDLGASINLMPLPIFRKLGLGELKPSKASLQLSDRSLIYPKGIIEDVLVKVDKFIFPVDFLVLDIEEDRDVPLILGSPFLATTKTLIDVQKGKCMKRWHTPPCGILDRDIQVSNYRR